MKAYLTIYMSRMCYTQVYMETKSQKGKSIKAKNILIYRDAQGQGPPSLFLASKKSPSFGVGKGPIGLF